MSAQKIYQPSEGAFRMDPGIFISSVTGIDIASFLQESGGLS
jgi:hypothetical protein